MARRKRPRLHALAAEVAAQLPELADPLAAISGGRILVGGQVARNSRTLVRVGTPVAPRAAAASRLHEVGGPRWRRSRSWSPDALHSTWERRPADSRPFCWKRARSACTPSMPAAANSLAGRALAATRWRVAGSIESPVRGARGAVEHLLHARRTGG